MEKLNTYAVYVKMFVLGESEEDAFDTADTAVSTSNLLDQDGVVGIAEVDVDDVELLDEDDEDDTY